MSMARKGNSQAGWSSSTLRGDSSGGGLFARRRPRKSWGTLRFARRERKLAAESFAPVCKAKCLCKAKALFIGALKKNLKKHCQDWSFCTLSEGAELGPINSLRRRDRFVAKDR